MLTTSGAISLPEWSMICRKACAQARERLSEVIRRGKLFIFYFIFSLFEVAIPAPAAILAAGDAHEFCPVELPTLRSCYARAIGAKQPPCGMRLFKDEHITFNFCSVRQQE